MKEHEMGGTCRTLGGDQKCIAVSKRKPKVKKPRRWNILEWILKNKLWACRLGLAGLGYGQMSGWYEHSN